MARDVTNREAIIDDRHAHGRLRHHHHDYRASNGKRTAHAGKATLANTFTMKTLLLVTPRGRARRAANDDRCTMMALVVLDAIILDYSTVCT